MNHTNAIRPGRLLFSVLLLASTIPACADSESTTSIGDQPVLTRTLMIKLQEGHVDLGQLVGDLLDLVRIDSTSLRDKVRLRINVNSKLGRMQINQLAKITHGIATFELNSDKLVLRIDQLKLRQKDKQLRTGLRGLVETWFPKLAQSAKARYGLRAIDAARDRVPLGKSQLDPFAVVLIHGLDDPGNVWHTLIPRLFVEKFSVYEMAYPNDQPILDSAELFADQLQELRSCGVKRITIVAHSMGGLVSREVLTNPAWYAGPDDKHNKYPQVVRLIMVGTPNHGSNLAKLRFGSEVFDQIGRALSGDGLLFGAILDGAGEAKIDLLPDSAFLQRLNKRPHPQDVLYTILAGEVSPVNDKRILWLKSQLPLRLAESVDDMASKLHELSAGLGDGCVSLKSAQLDSVKDFHVLKGNHITIVRNILNSSTRITPAEPLILSRLKDDRDAHGRK